MINKKLINWFCLSGVISFVFYVLHDIVGGLNYPNYNRMSQAVSDLTSVNAPSFVIANGFSSVYGIFACLCCTLICIIIQENKNKKLRFGIYLFSVMNWISAIGYSLFPLSESGYAGQFQDIMHTYVVTILVVVLSIISLLLIIIGCFKKNIYKSLTIFAVITLALMFAGAIGINVVPPEYFGIAERFSTYSAVMFNAVLGIYGFGILKPVHD